MRKVVLVAVIALLLSTAAFADHEGLGIGIVGGGGIVHNGFGFWGLSLKVPAVPIFWAISFPYFGSNGFAFGISGDYYFIDKNLVSNTMTNEDGNYNFKLDWYFGLGGYFNASFFEWEWWNTKKQKKEYKTKGDVDFGVRVPLGLSWHIIRPLELFVALVPGIGFHIYPEWSKKNNDWGTGFKTHFAGSGEIGLRVWIKNKGKRDEES